MHLSGKRTAKVQRRRTSTFRERAWPFDPTRHARHIQDIEGRRQQLVAILDDHGFNWQVFAVAASGFFTDSFNLFASNVILPCLAFVYWDTHSPDRQITMNALTLAGSAVGQILFGFLADKYGRQRLYGVELVIVIFSTIGLAQSSTGVVDMTTGQSSMDISGWLMAWRFVMGIGIGAEYSLSACITAEWSAKDSRARMMASVFLMQPLGQLMAYVVGLSALAGLSRYYDFSHGNEEAKLGVDILWRIVTGVGAVPAIVAILFRWTIPESGRYTYDVRQDGPRALSDTRKVFRKSSKASVGASAHEMQRVDVQDHANTEAHIDGSIRTPARVASVDEQLGISMVHGFVVDDEEYDLPEDDEDEWSQFTFTEIWTYFVRDGNWRYLAGTSLTWFLLDFAFYGLGFNNPGTMAKLWTSHRMADNPSMPSWLRNSAVSHVNGTIYDVLYTNAKESMITVSIGSILGTVLMIMLINKFDRRLALIWSFIAVATVTLVTGILFLYFFHTAGHPVLIVFYALIQFGMAFGPNTLTFIIPAEIFPTRYRCTAYGVAAASGKLGSVFVQVAFMTWSHGSLEDPNSHALGYLMFLFGGFLLLGGLVAWAWIPSVQERANKPPRYPLKSKSLEDLAKGVPSLLDEDKVGFRNRSKSALRYCKERFNKT